MGLFGYSRSEVEDALQRSTRAVLIGGLFHIDHTDDFNLNQEASAYLYSEMLSHLIFCIGIVYNHKIFGKKSWATSNFMETCIKREIEAYEKENSFSPGTILSPLFKRVYEIKGMSSQDRMELNHIKESVQRIYNLDKNANITTLKNTFEGKTRDFVEVLMQRF